MTADPPRSVTTLKCWLLHTSLEPNTYKCDIFLQYMTPYVLCASAGGHHTHVCDQRSQREVQRGHHSTPTLRAHDAAEPQAQPLCADEQLLHIDVAVQLRACAVVGRTRARTAEGLNDTTPTSASGEGRSSVHAGMFVGFCFIPTCNTSPRTWFVYRYLSGSGYAIDV